MQCQISNKRSGKGNRVSHSQVKTHRRFHANVSRRRLLNPATGTFMTLMISSRAQKTLAKWQSSGKVYDLRELVKSAKG